MGLRDREVLTSAVKPDEYSRGRVADSRLLRSV